MTNQDKPVGEDGPCPGCGDGDKVPAGYFLCPVCDAEWDDDGAALPNTGEPE